MSNNTIIALLIVALVVAVGLWVHGLRVGARFGFRRGEESQQPKIALLRDEVGTLTDAKKRLQFEAREVERKRGENKQRGEELDERERQISKIEQSQRDADDNLKSRARKLREESEELEGEKWKAQWAQKKANGTVLNYAQNARSAVPVYVGDVAAERECAGVYVVSRKGAVKVGITDDFSRRFKELQAQCKSVGIVDLRPEVLVPMDEGRRLVEARVHELLNDHQTAGEWFSVSPEDAAQKVIRQAWLVRIDNALHREFRHTETFKPMNPLSKILDRFGGITPMHVAAAENDAPCIRSLARKFAKRMDDKDAAGHTPMDWAVGCNAPDAIAALAKFGAQIDARNHARLMHLAASNKAHESIGALVKLGVGADVRDEKSGMTPMHLAESAECVDALARYGADVDARDNTLHTPMHYARNSGVVAALVKHGADINAKNNIDESPLCDAVDRHDINLESKRESRKSRAVVMSLVEHGANVTGLEKNGITLMHCAAGWDDVDLIEVLAKRDEDLVGATTDDGWTPLHTAASHNSDKAIGKLVRLGAFVDAQTYREEETPLHQTVENENTDAANALLANGAYVNLRAMSGTPLDYCGEQYGYVGIDEETEEDEPGYKLIKILTEFGGVAERW